MVVIRSRYLPRYLLGLMMGLVLFVSRPVLAADPTADDLVKARILSDVSAIEPGRPFTVAVYLKIAPKWHIYWVNSGDAGIPTTVKFDLPEGFTASALQYPTPIRIEQAGGIIMFGYSDEVMLLTTITPPAKVATSTIPIAATVKYLVCDDSCLPGEAKLSMSLPVGSAKPSSDAPSIAKFKDQLPVPELAAVKSFDFKQSEKRKNEATVSLTIEWPTPPTGKIEWFPPASDGLVFSDIKIATHGKTTIITSSVQRLTGQKVDWKALDSVVGYATPDGRRGATVPMRFPDNIGW